MKFRSVVYGFFILTALFAAYMGYLFYTQGGGSRGTSVFEGRASGSTTNALIPERGKTASGGSGRLLIAYSGDIQGDMLPCGCTEPPSGGLPRRLTVLRDYKASHAGIPMLIVDTGHSFRHSEKTDDPTNKHIAEALDVIGVSAINANVGDLRRLNRLAELGWDPAPLKGAYVSSALEQKPQLRFPSKSSAVLTVSAGEGAAQVKAGILAVTESAGDVSDVGQGLEFSQALRKHLPEVESRADVVVLLTWLKDAQITEIARQFPGIDVIINGSPVSEGREFQRVGKTVIVESARKGIGVGMLDLQFDSAGRVTNYTNQIIPLPPMVAEAPRMVEFIKQARKDYSAWCEAEAKRQPPLIEPRLYVGPEGCKTCHEKAYRAWSRSGHARSLDSLKKDSSQYDGTCLSCHVTAFDAERGFVDVIRTPQLSSVQCEACHGSSLDHSRKPQEIHPGLGPFQHLRRKVKPEFCQRCHDSANSPRFNYDAYWKKIAH